VINIKQLFNKSGMMIVFFAVTFFLCSFLISLLINADNSDILSSFSDKANYLVVTQEHNSGSALTYSDIANILSVYPVKGTVKIELYNKLGYMMFNYLDKENPGGAVQLLDVYGDTPQAVIKPVLEPYCMEVDGHNTINLMGENYIVVALNIYSNGSSTDFILNSAGFKNSKISFQGLSIILDAGESTSSVTDSFINDITKKNPQVGCTVVKLSEVLSESGAIGPNKAIIIIAILLIGLLMMLNASVFTNSWISSKKSEIIARRICGADDSDIKKLIFGYYIIISAVGTLIGFVITFSVMSLPFVSYYLGSVNPAAGFISAVFLLIISGIISYDRGEKYSHEQIDVLRRM